MWYTYVIIAAILLAAELLYFRIADKCNIIDKPNERSSHTKVVIRGGGIICILGSCVLRGGVVAVPGGLDVGGGGVSFVDDIHSLPDSVRLVVQFVAMGLIPDTPLWHWGYLVVVCGALAVGYVAFMKKYYHLYEEYLKSLEK